MDFSLKVVRQMVFSLNIYGYQKGNYKVNRNGDSRSFWYWTHHKGYHCWILFARTFDKDKCFFVANINRLGRMGKMIEKSLFVCMGICGYKLVEEKDFTKTYGDMFYTEHLW